MGTQIFRYKIYVIYARAYLDMHKILTYIPYVQFVPYSTLNKKDLIANAL
jgi:hypothetical protein